MSGAGDDEENGGAYMESGEMESLRAREREIWKVR